MTDILMSETCWAHKKWNKNIQWQQVGLLFSNITMMHGPINIRLDEYAYQGTKTGKVVPVYGMRADRGIRGIASLIFNLSTRR